MEKYEHQLREVKYNIESFRTTKNKKHIYKRYCNDILTFDIETTSAWLENGKIIGYKTGYDSEYWNNLQPLCLPYIWQFSFNEKVYYGREFKDFLNVLNDIPKDYNITIWVHNLSYEFHFLCNILTWKDVFARSPHKPMKCTSNEYPNIEFRCSYMLTRLSLDAWGKQLNVPKMTGDLDYEIIRTPLTELSEKELKYCEQDCIVVYNGIKDYLKTYKTIRNIPLTQTGTVRREVKNMLTEDARYVKDMKRLVPKDAIEYKMLLDLFSGGYTHASRKFAGQVQEGLIEHYDFTSSYPTVMCCERFPFDKWHYTGETELPKESTFINYAYIMKLSFTNIKCQTYNTYIQASKCTTVNVRLDNGRVLKADKLIMYVTEQDYLTIKETYTWESLEVIDLYKCHKNYLPKKLIEYILYLYGNKTKLKDVKGYEDLYMQSKQYINSMFGMCVTAIVQPNIKYDNGNWVCDALNEITVNKYLDKLKATWTSEKRYFLSYSWGIWVTAYARRNLWKCIESCDENVLYCDTDSIFVLGKNNFNWYNKEITNKLKNACDSLNIDFELTRPKTPKGVAKPLGIFTKEDDCCQFISLGAKRYVERRIEDNKLHLTVSGINKDAVAVLKNDIYNFKNGLNFDKDDENVHKQLATYVNDMPIVKYDDGYISTYKTGINLRRNGYLLTMTDDYMKVIDYITKIEYTEQSIIKIKSSFSTETEEEE